VSTASQACGRIATLGDLRRVTAAADAVVFLLVDRLIRLGDNEGTATARAAQDALSQIGLTLGLRQGVLAPVDPPDAARDGAPAPLVGRFAICRLMAVIDDLYVRAEKAAPGALADGWRAYVAALSPHAAQVTVGDASTRNRKILGVATVACATAAVAVGVFFARWGPRRRRPFA
jgi:hypothetical protein